MRSSRLSPWPGVFLALSLLFFPEFTLGTGIRDLQDSWLISAEEVQSVLTGNPEPLLPHTWSLMELGQGRLFSVPGLEQVLVSGRMGFQVAGRRFLFEGSWQQFGKGLYREDTSSLSLVAGIRPGMGLEVTRTATTLDGQALGNPWELSLVLRHHLAMGPGSILKGGLNLAVGPAAPEPGFQVRHRFAEMTLMVSGAALGLGLDRRPDGTPVLGFEVFLGAGPAVGFTLRADPASGSLGPGLQVRRGFLLVRTSHLFHPDLGQTHRFALCLMRRNG